MIPATLHYIWIGGTPLPDRFRENIATWRRHNPGFEIREWNEANLDWSSRYMRAAYTFRYWSRVTNLARLEILRKHGGIYLDVDVEVVRPLRPLLDNACFLGFQDSGPNATWVNNAVFGATPDHWFVNACIERLLRCFTGVERMDSRHGPGNVTQVLIDNGLAGYHEHGTMLRDVRLYPRAAFYPYHWNETFDPAMVTSETFLLHHWARSWVPGLHEDARARSRGRLDRLKEIAAFFHLRTQWRLERRPTLLARYHRALAIAAAARFDLHRPRPLVSQSG
jgi:Glycosyltransferase sugar-binding region containing DXD motif/Alpha 1,4-glycosyltransferase conserved region